MDDAHGCASVAVAGSKGATAQMAQAHTYMEVSSRATQEAKAEEAQDAYMDVRLQGCRR